MHYRLALMLTVPWLVAACAGGGGGGGGSSPTQAPFVRFRDIQYPGTVHINGSSQEATYTVDTAGSAQKVTSVSAPTPFESGASYDASTSATGLIKAVFTTARGSAMTIDMPRGDEIKNYGLVSAGITANGQDVVLTPTDVRSLGWDYQSFGVWATGIGTSGGGAIGVVTVGSQTAGVSIPTTGTALYTGISMGRYVGADGAAQFTLSNMLANTNFNTRTVSFITINTLTIVPGSGTLASQLNLNMSGNLTYDPGVNKFSGTVTTAGGGPADAAMVGTATGKFYGPLAEEMGGTFGLTNGRAAYLGAFGGIRGAHTP